MQVWQAGRQIGANASGDTPPTEPARRQNVSPAFQRATFRRIQSRIHGRPSAHGCRIDSNTDSNARRTMAANVRNGASWVLCVCRLCISGRLWSSMDKGANRFGGASRFSARRGFTVRSAYAKAADHPGRGLTAGFSRVYTQLRRSCYLCARVVPQKNFFESPFRGIHLARKTCILPKQPKKCAMLLASAGQAAHRQNHCRRWTTCGRTTA